MNWANPVLAGQILGFTALAYLFLVRSLRWRRYNAIHAKYEAKWKEGNLTPAEAQQVMHVSTLYDMPLLLNKALALALFKTYGIPTISKLLLTTRELSSSRNVAKRYADTEILISTWVTCPISGFQNSVAPPSPEQPAEDPRAAIAIARTNYLHSKYKISNGDFLYTMSLFVKEPTVWARQYGWRALSPMESDAYFIFWSDIAKKMGITDIPETREALDIWSNAYEEVYMVPDQTNNEVAGFTIGELLFAVPEMLGLKAFGERVVIVLLEERVRIAMLLAQQPRLLHWLANSLLVFVWVVHRYILLPRRSPSASIVDIRLPKPDADGEIRMRPSEYRSTPWYKPEATGISLFFSKLAVKLGYYADIPAPKYHSRGYKIEELGPQQYEHAGYEEVFRNATKIQGCPIVGPWVPAKSSENPTAVQSDEVLVPVD